MTRTDLLNIIAGAIRRNFTTASEQQALEAAEEVLREIAGIRLRLPQPATDKPFNSGAKKTGRFTRKAGEVVEFEVDRPAEDRYTVKPPKLVSSR